MTLGQKLKRLRVTKGITQKDLAEKLNVTFQTISKWENDTNEPDIATLKELANIFHVSYDYLLGENESTNEQKQADKEDNKSDKIIVIHQKELHVCERCKKDIPENELVMEDVRVGYGDTTEYRKAYYHKQCLEQEKKDRAERERVKRLAHGRKGAAKSFGWGGASGVVSFAISLVVFLTTMQFIHPGLSVLYSFLISYGIFAMIYCIVSESYIYDVFITCAKPTIRWPMLIFSWSFDGIRWLIGMKLLFVVLGFLIGVLATIFAIVLSAVLASVSFPFILIHNIHTQYEDMF